MVFSKLAARPPSSHPAECFMKFPPPMMAPHNENTLSYAACASTVLAAQTLLVRYGTL